LCGDGDAVDAQVRHGAVAALAVDVDVEEVEGGHDFVFVDSNVSGGQFRPVVQGIDAIHREAGEQAFVAHAFAAGDVFFGGLEDEYDASGEVARGAQVFGGAEQHGGVAVVAAGVHFACGL